MSTPADLPVLRSTRLILRRPVPADLQARLEVPPDPEAHHMYGGSGEPPPHSTSQAGAGLAELTHQDLTQRRTFIIAALVWPDGAPVAEAAGRNIGGLGLHRIDWRDRRATLAIGIFDRRFWSSGYGSEAIRLLLGYAFDSLDLHRVGLRVLEYNVRAIRAYEKCGFVREGIERESASVDGRWYSDIMMGILASEYRSGA
jgi:RimJ/RimL family protein N-acetyltransferase